MTATCKTHGHLWGVEHKCIFCGELNLDPIESSPEQLELTAYQIAKDNALWQDMTQFFSHRNDAEDRAIMWLTQNVPSWQVY